MTCSCVRAPLRHTRARARGRQPPSTPTDPEVAMPDHQRAPTLLVATRDAKKDLADSQEAADTLHEINERAKATQALHEINERARREGRPAPTLADLHNFAEMQAALAQDARDAGVQAEAQAKQRRDADRTVADILHAVDARPYRFADRRGLVRLAAARAHSYTEFSPSDFRAFEDEVIDRIVRREISVNTFLQIAMREFRRLDDEHQRAV